MRRLLLATLLAASACKPAAKPPPAEPEVVRTMPHGPDAPMNMNQPDRTRVAVDLAAARGAIQVFQQTNGGKSPERLEQLGVHLSFPADVSYDPGTGQVRSLTYPTL